MSADKKYTFVLKWSFTCQAALPQEPEGTGHRADLVQETLREGGPDSAAQEALTLGRARPQCRTTNRVIAQLRAGKWPIRCRYCGAPAFTLVLVPEEGDQPPAALVRTVDEVVRVTWDLLKVEVDGGR